MPDDKLIAAILTHASVAGRGHSEGAVAETYKGFLLRLPYIDKEVQRARQEVDKMPGKTEKNSDASWT